MQGARPITALALRGGAGVVGGVMAYVLFQVIQRMEWNQKRRIRNILARPPLDLASFSPGPLFLPRSEKHEFIVDVLNSDPGGPILVTGPQGSGKTMILKRALAQRPNTVYLSLRATPVTTGDALLVALVTNMGFLLPPNELLGRAIFNREAGPVPPAELDRALSSITGVLREEKAWGWVRTLGDGRKVVLPPVICIDELNHSEVGSGLLEDAQFWRIVDWAMHLSDNRLAHIVFASALDVADLLDRYPGFRVRRQKVHFDFPRVGSVRDYYGRILNPFLRDVLGAVPRPAKLPPTPPTPAPVQPAVTAQPQLAPVRESWWSRVMKRSQPPADAVSAEAAEPAVSPPPAPAVPHAVNDVTETAPRPVVHAPAQASPSPAPAPADAASGATPAPKPSAQLSEVSVGDTAFPIAAAKAAAAKAKAVESSSASGTAAATATASSAAPSTAVASTTASADAHAASTATSAASAVTPAAAAVAVDDDDTIYLLEPSEIERLIDVIGGHLKDIDTVVSAITAGTHVTLVLERLLADAAEQVERSLDDILASELRRDAVVNAASGSKVKAMAKLLRARATVADHPLPPWNYSKLPSKERLAAYARYLRAWTLISELGARKYIAKRELARRIFAEVPAELDFFLDVGLVISVNVKASTKLQHHRVNFNIESSVPGTYVTASSPRMRVAFRVLTSDPRLQLQTRRVQAALRAAALREEEHLLTARIGEAVAERAYHAGQLGTLYTRDTAMRTTAAREWLAAAAAASVSPVHAAPAASSAPAAPRVMDVEDAPLAGMARLSASLHGTQEAVRRCEDEIAALRKRLASTRAAAEEAEKAAVVHLPNTDITPALDTPGTEQTRETQAAEQKERDKVVDAMFEGEVGAPRVPATNEVFAYNDLTAQQARGFKAAQDTAVGSASPFLYGSGAAGNAADALSPWAQRPVASGFRWWL